MSRFSFLLVLFVAFVAIVTAQSASSSSSGTIVIGGSSSSSMGMASSSSAMSSMSSEMSSSSMESSAAASSSSEMSSSASEMSSSSAVMSTGGSSAESSGMFVSSSSAALSFIPANWGDIPVLSNGSSIDVTWASKTSDNPMFNFGTNFSFVVNNVSGGILHLQRGNTYNFSIDALAATHGFYWTLNPEGNNPSDNLTAPIFTAGNINLYIPTDFLSNSTVAFFYYASADTPFAGGATILGTQSAAALKASFAIMMISAFISLVFPKW